MTKRKIKYSQVPVHQWTPAWHRLLFRGRTRDYLASAVWFHLIGCIPMGVLCALVVWFADRGTRMVTIGQLVSLVFGLMLAWWVAGIGIIRPLPRAWPAPPPGRGRHAARYVFSGAIAMLTACGAVTAAHFIYQGLLGYTHGLLDVLTACGGIWWGQAAGCLTLRTPSRDRVHLQIALGILGVLMVISIVGVAI